MQKVTLAATLAGVQIALAPAIRAQQVDTVRVGSGALRAARLQVGEYTIESVRRAEGRDTTISETTQSIARERYGSVDAYVIRTTHASAGGDTTVGVIVVRASDFALLHHRVKAARDSAAVAVTEGHLTGWVVLPGEPVRLLDQELEGWVFPIEGQVPWLFPLLPLAEGYAAAIPHYSQWAGAEQWSAIRVVGVERVTVGGRAFDCWVVDGGELFPGHRVTYWVDQRSRRIVQGVARGSEPGPEYWSWLRVG